MSYDYSENMLVQESAGNLLRDELGWDVRFAYNTEILEKNGTFGRESYKEIVLLRYFREALKKLNPWINDSQISEAQKTLEQRLSTSSLLQVNEEKYFLIREGIPVTVKKPNGQTETKKASVIDFQRIPFGEGHIEITAPDHGPGSRFFTDDGNTAVLRFLLAETAPGVIGFIDLDGGIQFPPAGEVH